MLIEVGLILLIAFEEIVLERTLDFIVHVTMSKEISCIDVIPESGQCPIILIGIVLLDEWQAFLITSEQIEILQ